MSADRATVVVVDDDQSVLGLLGVVLGSQHATHAYTSPVQALAGMATHGVDVLVTDLRMPEMNGVELMQAVLERWPHCRSVVLTGYGTVPDAVCAMKAGASEFLAKPVDTQRLLAVVSQLVGQRTALDEPDRNAIEGFWAMALTGFVGERGSRSR